MCLFINATFEWMVTDDRGSDLLPALVSKSIASLIFIERLGEAEEEF